MRARALSHSMMVEDIARCDPLYTMDMLGNMSIVY